MRFVSVLEPIVARYRDLDIRRFFRWDAAFARPELYEYLEAEGYLYTIRCPPTRCCMARSSRC